MLAIKKLRYRTRFKGWENEKIEIKRAISRLIDDLPIGGNYQITVGDVVKRDCDTKSCEIEACYFEPIGIDYATGRDFTSATLVDINTKEVIQHGQTK